MAMKKISYPKLPLILNQLQIISDSEWILGPIKKTIRVRIDKAYKDLRGLAHYFNRRQIRAEKAPIDTELGYIKGILDFSESAALRQPAP